MDSIWVAFTRIWDTLAPSRPPPPSPPAPPSKDLKRHLPQVKPSHPTFQPQFKYPTSSAPRVRAPHPSRHVLFSPSTLAYQSHRHELLNAETSAFQNFVQEVYDANWQLQLSLAQQEGKKPPQRLSLKDLILLQRVAKDLWNRKSSHQKQKYVILAKEARQRRQRRLPPDPYRSLPSSKNLSSRKMFDKLDRL